MKASKIIPFFFLLLPILSRAQFGNNTQVSIPVIFSEIEPSQQSMDIAPMGEVSGIVLMLFENQDEDDNILLREMGEPILWMEKMGVSSKATFIFPEYNELGKMELLLSHSRLSVKFILNGSEIAHGSISKEREQYKMRLVGNINNEGDLKRILGKVNNYLMRLHLHAQKKVIIRPGFNEDTLNIVCGHDTQFDTDFDIIWLDNSFYDRIKNEAEAAYLQLSSSDSTSGLYRERVENSALVEHTANMSKIDKGGMNGSIVILFEVLGDKNYYFLRAKDKYQIAIDYYYRKNEIGNALMSIEKLMLRNVKTGDFVEMSTMDLTASSIPIIYIDLINSVIMDDYGSWSIVQIFTVLEDIFSIIDLPNEKG